MFGHRSDGKKVKGMGIIDKAEPFFMPQRIDAVNYTTVKIKCDTIDEFIARERKGGDCKDFIYSQKTQSVYYAWFNLSAQHNLNFNGYQEKT